MTRRSPIHLAVALDGAGWHPAAWRHQDATPDALFTAPYWVSLTREAERGLLDFVSVEDTLAIQSQQRGLHDGRTDRVRGRLDATLVAARVAPLTRSIGIIPVATTTHTEPFHISKAIATLDYVSEGRAGVQVRVSSTALEAAQFGRRTIPEGSLDERTREELFDEAADFVEVLRCLWDSWEDGAEIRDATTGRFIDRDRLHYVDFIGRWFSVRGPSITPRPPQGQPIVAALAHAAIPFRLAARSADVVFITPRDPAHAEKIISAIREEERQSERRDPPLRVFVDLVALLDTDPNAARLRLGRLNDLDGDVYQPDASIVADSATELADLIIAFHEAGAFGVRLRPAVLPYDLSAIVDDLVPILQRTGRFRSRYEEATLRERLGLARPENRYASNDRPLPLTVGGSSQQ